MRFHRRFEKAVAAVNERCHRDSMIQQALDRYHNRSLVLKIRKDATYVFCISKNGVEYQVNPANEPNDMYVEMDLDKAKRLVYRQSLGIFDILSVVHRNIGMAEIDFAKKLFGRRKT
jgi:hypothetical protein